MKERLGISLLEIIVAISIFLVILGIGIISFSGFLENIELDNSTKYLISKLKLAQQYTVTTQLKHAISFDLFSNTYHLVKKEPLLQTLENLSLSEGIIFNSIAGLQNNEAVFNSAGAVDYSGEIILLSQESGKQTKIYIKPSGYVTWEKVNY
jgi:type II secretory pathway pseudopilin PulG